MRSSGLLILSISPSAATGSGKMHKESFENIVSKLSSGCPRGSGVREAEADVEPELPGRPLGHLHHRRASADGGDAAISRVGREVRPRTDSELQNVC